MLEPYGIKPKQIWPKGKRTKQRRGYLRSAFEEAWRSYCYEEEEEAAATKTAKILRLRSD